MNAILKFSQTIKDSQSHAELTYNHILTRYQNLKNNQFCGHSVFLFQSRTGITVVVTGQGSVEVTDSSCSLGSDGLTHTNLRDILTWWAASLGDPPVGAGHRV